MPTSAPAPRLNRRFFARPTLEVARALLGQRLVRVWRGQRIAGLICETEAYIGQEDLACHARVGRTPRTAVMFGPPGHAYVYFTYGMHWMLNCVTETDGFPAAVLLRAIFPAENEAQMRRWRAATPLANGPAKLTQALGVDKAYNGADLCDPAATLFIERASRVPAHQITTHPRVGLGRTPEPWLSKLWNFQWQPAAD